MTEEIKMNEEVKENQGMLCVIIYFKIFLQEII